jgi:hypothetical protein
MHDDLALVAGNENLLLQHTKYLIALLNQCY